jgi:hypothetical protein
VPDLCMRIGPDEDCSDRERARNGGQVSLESANPVWYNRHAGRDLEGSRMTTASTEDGDGAHREARVWSKARQAVRQPVSVPAKMRCMCSGG